MTTVSGGNAVVEIVTKGPKGDKGDPGIGFPAGGITGQVLAKASNDDYDGDWITVAGTGTVTSVDLDAPTGFTVSDGPVTTSGTITLAYAAGYQGFTSAEASKLFGIEVGAQVNVATDLLYDAASRLLSSSTGADVTLPLFTSSAPGLVAASGGGTTNFLRADGTWAEPPGSSGGSGTVTSVSLTAPTGFSVSGSPVTTSGTIAISFAAGYSLPTTTSQGNWDTAYSERLYWDGGSTGLNAVTARTSLGLGNSATLNVGTTAGTVASGDVLGVHVAAADPHPNYALESSLASVATSGAYSDLTGTPTVPSAADATPQPLGTAAIGVSADYAREDHVHAMPSAADVGADATGTASSAISAHEAAADPHPGYALETSLASVAISGAYSDLSGTPALVTSLDGLSDVTLSSPADQQVLKYDAATSQWINAAAPGGGSGTVTSVSFTAPTGFSVSGSPITTSGTIELSYAAGYQGYTSTEAGKLAGIAAGAEVNVNADWNATSGDAQILNKPTLGTAAALDTGTTSGTVATGDRGLPASGTTGQVLTKSSGTDYDASWSDLPATDLSYDPATRQLASSTGADATLPLFTSTEAGLTPLSGGGTTNFLRADGTWAAPPSGAGIADGDKGDITVSASGTVWSIDAGVVSTTELGGDITTAGKALLDDADAAAQRTTLGLGTAATQNVGTSAGNVVQLDGSAKLPAVDGSQLINLPSGGGGGLTHFVESEDTASPNATTPVDALTATDAGYTDIDVALVAKGTGATLAQVPDGTAAGGNKRGWRATDWQKSRLNSSHVASGSYSVIGGGESNIASASYSAVAGGTANRASSNYSFVGGGSGNTAQTNTFATVCGGGTNNASGTFSFVGGGWANNASSTYSVVCGGLNNISSAINSTIVGGINCTANSSYSFATGFRATTRSILGYHAFGPIGGDAIQIKQGVQQMAFLLLARQTADATPTVLTSNTSAASTTNQVILPNNAAYYFKGSVIAGVTGAGDTAAWSIEGAIKRGANAASTTMVGSPTVTMTHNDAGAASWTITVTADTTNGGIKVEVTGAAATTIRWVCKIETTEMTY